MPLSRRPLWPYPRKSLEHSADSQAAFRERPQKKEKKERKEKRKEIRKTCFRGSEGATDVTALHPRKSHLTTASVTTLSDKFNRI